MKLSELLARRSTPTMNPQFMSDEYMNRRRSFGRGGAGNIRSREEAILPVNIPPSIHESHPHHDQPESPSETDTDGSTNNSNDNYDDNEVSQTHSQRSQSPHHSNFHYRYHYRHYRPHHFINSHSDSTDLDQHHQHQDHESKRERERRRSSVWSSMSISSSTGTHESALSSSRLLNGLSGLRQVLSGSSGVGHGQPRRRKGGLDLGKERA
ncbi:hypothetical protein QBC32DRAFT_119717 [Pseudoneurospora amorphoporcata]|uniref:Uncharacterized protein n=1 Tax=Pseudoneurospora amorphoporcata TaxID=241081 RepID=A0AAN6SH97_9PEZI|nr:hypothetical protein QBC32DRAFT_119717 [Pseudoneurospora amorphoporcata]